MRSNSTIQQRQQLEVQEMEQGFHQVNAGAGSVGTHHSWLPIFGLRLFQPSVVALNVVQPLELGRAVSSPYNGLLIKPSPVNRRERITVYRHI